MILRHLLCDPADGQWCLGSEYVVDEVSVAHSDHPIVHLSWNPNGIDLAIVDVLGQLSIFSVLPPMNRLNLFRRCVVDPEDSLSTIVGLMWLNTERTV